MLKGRNILREKLERYSRRPDGAAVNEAQAEELVVLVPPRAVGEAINTERAPLGIGFELARSLLDQGQRVRLVAHGATIRGAWPKWAASADRLTLTELGAYRIGNPSEETRALAADVRAWLDRLFEGAVEGVGGGSIFYASAGGRFLQALFEAVPYVHGLAEAHPSARFDCIDPDWVGLRLLERRIEPEGGRPKRPQAPASAAWPLKVGAHFAYRFGRAAAGQVRNFLRSAPSRRRLAKLRARKPAEDPSVWLVMVPDWKRINRHVVDGVVVPALEHGEPLGVLLCTTLLPGERFDHALGERRGSKLWPALDLLGTSLEGIAIDQVVGPEDWGGLIRLLLRGAGRSAAIAFRLARSSPLLSSGSLQLDLSPHLPAVAALGTTDVLQALAAADAVAAAKRRHDFSGAAVVFAALNLVETTTVDQLLQRAGGTTVDFVHGAGGDNWYGMTETHASYRAVWTRTDAETCRKLGATPLVVRLPGCRQPSGQGAAGNRKVLVLTNYVHVDTAAAGYPLEPFQTELLEAIGLLASAFPGSLEFRWRPHPNDDRAMIERALRRAPGLDLSLDQPMERDIDWADIVITSPSSTVPQALLAGRPVFVHVPPALRCLTDIEAIHPDRSFFYANELVTRMQRFLAAAAEDARRALAPERETFAALFDDSPDKLADLPAALAAARSEPAPARPVREARR